MITKAQAIAFRQQYIDTFPDRVDALVKQAAIAGQTSVLIGYSPLSDGAATAFVAAAQGAPNNWTTSSVDTVNKTITIAP